MKEREPNDPDLIGVELTVQPNSSNLEKEGEIFMSEPGGGEIQSKEPTENQSLKPAVTMQDSLEKRQEAARIYFERENQERSISFEERQTQRLMVEHGVLPQEGGSDDEPNSKITDELKDYIIKSREGAPIGITRNLRRILRENGVPKSQIDFFANHPEEFRQSLETMLSQSESLQEAPEQTEGPAKEQKPPAPPAEAPNGLIGKEGEEEESKPIVENPARTPEELRKETETIRAGLTGEEEEYLANAEAVAQGMGMDSDTETAFKNQIAHAILNNRGRRAQMKQDIEEARARGEEVSGLPENLEDLVKIIMRSETDAWKDGGERALIKDSKVVKENFLAWVRKRMWEIDDFNPFATVNYFSDIYVKYGYMQINFMEMVLTGTYFLKREIKNGVVSTHKDNDYEELKQELIREAFTYNSDKNASVTYVNKMALEQELPGVVVGLWTANPNLRSDHLEHTLTLPSTKGDKIAAVREKVGEGFDESEIQKILKENMDLGEGVRRALLTYFHISDFEMLEKIHGRDSRLFKKEYIEEDYNAGTYKKNEDGTLKTTTGKANDEAIRLKKKDAIKYDADGNLVRDSENIDNFLKYINIYNDADKEGRIVSEVRIRIREYLVDSLGLDYEEARFAETWAYNKTRPMLIGARGDTAAAAFDAAARNTDTLAYRFKQWAKKRKGQIGNIFDIGVIKRTTLTPLEEITDVHGRTIIEAIQGGQGSSYSEHNPFDKTRKEYQSLEFGQDSGQRWAAMSFGNGDAIKNFLMQGVGFDIDKLIASDENGRPVIDPAEADKFLEEIQKKIRYKWCTYKGINYSKIVRVRDQKFIPLENPDGSPKIDRNGEQEYRVIPVFRDMPQAFAYFDTDVLNFVKSDIERVKQRTGKTDASLREEREENVWSIDGVGDIDFSQIQHADIRDYLWKQIEKALVARKLEAHRNVFSERARYGYAKVEKFYDFFRIKEIWDKEDEKEVRALSKTRELRLLGEEIPTSFLFGFLSGAWKEIRRASPGVLSKAA